MIATEKLRNMMKRQFPLLSAWVKQRKLRSALEGKSAQQIFTRLVQNNKWGDQESVCGAGSAFSWSVTVPPALTSKESALSASGLIVSGSTLESASTFCHARAL